MKKDKLQENYAQNKAMQLIYQFLYKIGDTFHSYNGY